jgi:hypothetical protein
VPGVARACLRGVHLCGVVPLVRCVVPLVWLRSCVARTRASGVRSPDACACVCRRAREQSQDADGEEEEERHWLPAAERAPERALKMEDVSVDEEAVVDSYLEGSEVCFVCFLCVA